MPPPEFGTPRRPGRDTFGGAAALVANSRLGQPFLPWQGHVADVSQEVIMDGPRAGFLAYSTVIVSVPRQSGKTTGLLFVIMVMRCLLTRLFGRRQRIIYTAQDRNNAREKFEQDFIERLTDAPGLVEGVDFERPRLANGSERIRFSRSRSTITISATSSNSGHGSTLDMPSIDEAWEHRTTDVDAGFRTPMITKREIRPGPQLWIVSTAGTEESLYLDRKLKQGREAVERGDETGTCAFHWAAPADTDVWERRLWWFCMPALGHTQSEESIAEEAKDFDEVDFRRAYFNQTQHRDSQPAVISEEQWGLRMQAASQIDGRMVFGVAVTDDQARTVVGVAGERAAGGAHVEVVQVGDGTTWAVDRLVDLVAEHHAEGVAVAPSSPAGALAGPLKARGIEVFSMTPQKQAQATGSFYSGVVDGTADGVWHTDQPVLAGALASAQKRHTGERAWVWQARSEDVDITSLEAVTLAYGALMSLPEEEEKKSAYDELGGFREW